MELPGRVACSCVGRGHKDRMFDQRFTCRVPSQRPPVTLLSQKLASDAGGTAGGFASPGTSPVPKQNVPAFPSHNFACTDWGCKHRMHQAAQGSSSCCHRPAKTEGGRRAPKKALRIFANSVQTVRKGFRSGLPRPSLGGRVVVLCA